MAKVVQGVLLFDFDAIESGLKGVKKQAMKAAEDTNDAINGYIFKTPEIKVDLKDQTPSFSDVLKAQKTGSINQTLI